MVKIDRTESVQEMLCTMSEVGGWCAEVVVVAGQGVF